MYTIDYTPYKIRDWYYEPLKNSFWGSLSENPNSIELLEQNPDKINWKLLSGNPQAIHLLEKNLEKIDWK